MGHVVWLWSVPQSSLGSCVVLQARLRQAAWHPSQACLLMLTHSTSIFLWTPQASASPIPTTTWCDDVPHLWTPQACASPLHAPS